MPDPALAESEPHSQKEVLPRGAQLTPTMPFTGPGATSWVAYIEGVPLTPRRWRDAGGLPGRRLRFDSAEASRVTAVVPAGAPFLRPDRLLALLAGAEVFPPSPPPTLPAARRRIELARALDVAVGCGVRLLRSVPRRWKATRGDLPMSLHHALETLRLVPRWCRR